MARWKIKGLDEFTKMLNNLPEETENEIKEVVAETALKIEADAKRLVPVDTGYLRRSITTEFPVADKSLSAVIGTNVEYALFVEFGTSKQTEKPFLTPAFEKHKNKFINQIQGIVKEMGD